MLIRHLYKKAFLFIAILGVVLSVTPAQAFIKVEDIPKLDRKVLMTKEEFYTKSDLTNVTDIDEDGTTALNFRIRLPKEWITLPVPKMENVQLRSQLFKMIRTYVSPARGDIRSRIEIRALDLKHFVSAQDWFLNFILLNGGNIDGLFVKSDRRVEAEYTTLDKGVSYTIRAVAEFTGGQVVLAEYYVPTEYFKSEREQQVWTMASFALTTPDEGPIEPVETYTFVDIVKFDYPQSWILYSPPITSIDRMEATILNLKGTSREVIDVNTMKLNGRVDVKVISKTLGTTEQEEITALKKSLKEKGLEIGELMRSVDDVKFHKQILKSKVDAYAIKAGEGVNNLAGYELWVAMVESSGRYYIMTLITMGRDESFYSWAQNTETFKFIMRSLAPVNDMN